MTDCLVNDRTTGYLVFVLVSIERVIDNPTSRRIRAVIYILRSENMSASEINRELCTVYCQHLMIAGSVRQRCIIFKDERKKISR
jgi:hypothetical protein